MKAAVYDSRKVLFIRVRSSYGCGCGCEDGEDEGEGDGRRERDWGDWIGETDLFICEVYCYFYKGLTVVLDPIGSVLLLFNEFYALLFLSFIFWFTYYYNISSYYYNINSYYYYKHHTSPKKIKTKIRNELWII